MATYSVDCERAATHIPAHPDRTVVGCTNPYSVYYREFSSRQEMERWFRRQSWQDKQQWCPWMASSSNRRLLARSSHRRPLPSQLALCGQQSLFA